jgi:PAS domain S-box-containing protein
LQFCGTTQKDLYGKNIEYTPVATVFDDAFDTVKKQVRAGIAGKEWYGELPLKQKGVVFACRIAPAVFEEGQRGVSVLLENITERKQAELALRESEATARALINAPTDSVLLLDPQGIILAINETAAVRMGRRQDELIGALIDDVLPKDIARARRSIISRVVEQKAAVRFEDERNGIWFDTVAYPVIDETGEVKKVAVIARDITDRIQTGGALRESEDRYRKLVEISPDAIILHSGGKIMYVNPAALTILGASHSDEIVGKNVLDFIQPVFREGVRINIEKDLRGDRTPPMELHMLRVDGTAVIVEGRGVRTLIDGAPAVQVAIRDITERKHAEEALRQSEGKLHAMLQSITDPMTMMDKSLTIIWANDAAQRCFGAGIVGMKCYEAFHQRLSPCEPSPCLTLRAFADGKMHRHETTVIDREGTRRFFDCTANVALRDENGRPAAVLEISRDCTELKRAEEALHKGSGRVQNTRAPGTGTKKASVE